MTSTGRRFKILDAVLWRLDTQERSQDAEEAEGEGLDDDAEQEAVGMAATFSRVEWVDGPVDGSSLVGDAGDVLVATEGGDWVIDTPAPG